MTAANYPPGSRTTAPGTARSAPASSTALARLKTYKILRDYRRAARTLAITAAGVAHLHNIALTG